MYVKRYQIGYRIEFWNQRDSCWVTKILIFIFTQKTSQMNLSRQTIFQTVTFIHFFRILAQEKNSDGYTFIGIYRGVYHFVYQQTPVTGESSRTSTDVKKPQTLAGCGFLCGNGLIW
jgi:hypothetical protein